MVLSIYKQAIYRQTIDKQTSNKQTIDELITEQQVSEQPLIAAKAYRSSLTPLFMVGTFMSTLVLSACQTAPYTMSTSHTDTTPTTMATQPSTSQRFEIEPSTSPTDMTRAPIHQGRSPSQGLPHTERPATNNNPLTQQTPVIQTPAVIPNEPIRTPSRDDYIISQPPVTPSHSDLLERARQSSRQQERRTTSTQSDLPAFRSLMQTGISQLKSGNLTAAENSFTRAQRLAPKSSAVYYYLSQVALKKNQPRKAEAMARRGLTVSEDANRRRSLWQLILVSGQQQNNARVIREAQQALR